MVSLYFNFSCYGRKGLLTIFSPDNHSLGAVNSKNLNGLRLCEPYVLFLSFLPSGPFGMKDSREMDNILSSFKAYGAE